MNALATIVTNNYIKEAIWLYQNLQKHNKNVRFYCLVVGSIPDEVRGQYRDIEWLSVDVLMNEGLYRELTTRYSAFEICCALRGDLHSFFCNRGIAEKWIVLDTDMYIASSLDPVWKELDQNDILLTPHRSIPHDEEFVNPYELDLLEKGLFNGGFVAMRASKNAAAASDWLRKRLRMFAFNGRRPMLGLKHKMFVDQLWLNLLPLYFGGVKVLYDPVYNLGHWNLSQGELLSENSKYYFNGVEVLLFHHSGPRLSAPHKVSIHTSLFERKHYYVWAEAFNQYQAERNGSLKIDGHVSKKYQHDSWTKFFIKKIINSSKKKFLNKFK